MVWYSPPSEFSTVLVIHMVEGFSLCLMFVNALTPCCLLVSQCTLNGKDFYCIPKFNTKFSVSSLSIEIIPTQIKKLTNYLWWPLPNILEDNFSFLVRNIDYYCWQFNIIQLFFSDDPNSPEVNNFPRQKAVFEYCSIIYLLLLWPPTGSLPSLNFIFSHI